MSQEFSAQDQEESARVRGSLSQERSECACSHQNSDFLEQSAKEEKREGENYPVLSDLNQYDEDGVREAIRQLLIAVGEDPQREGLRDTPDRMARAYREIFEGLYRDPAEVLDAQFDIGHSEMVLVKDIPMYSVCEHHLLPFHGVAHVAYIPSDEGKVTGLSKLARLVEGYARRPQVQERITTQVADAVAEKLGARGVLVVIEAEHMCMSMRGVRKPGSKTVTSAVRGIFRNPATRAEAFSLIKS